MTPPFALVPDTPAAFIRCWRVRPSPEAVLSPLSAKTTSGDLVEVTTTESDAEAAVVGLGGGGMTSAALSAAPLAT